MKPIIGPPARGEMYFGRESLTGKVWQSLDAGRSILLTGPRRMGKTSIMLDLCDRPKASFHVFYIDAEKFSCPTELLAELYFYMLQAQAFKTAAAHIGVQMPQKLGFHKRTAEGEEPARAELILNCRVWLAEDWKGRGEALLRGAAGAAHPVVVCLDEIPWMLNKMEPQQCLEFLTWFRAIRLAPDLQGKFRFVLGASIGFERLLTSLCALDTLNDLQREIVGPFDDQTASDYVLRTMKTHRIEVPRNSLNLILGLLSPPIPFFLNILLQAILDKNPAKDKPLRKKTIMGAYSEFVLGVQCKPHFEYFYQRLFRTGYYPPACCRTAIRILNEIAKQGGIRRDALFAIYLDCAGPDGEIGFERLMAILEDESYIAKTTGGTFEFAFRPLRDWWLRNKVI